MFHGNTIFGIAFINNSKIAAQSELRFGFGRFFFLLETARRGEAGLTNNDDDDEDGDEGGGEVDRRRERRERHTTMAGLVNEREYGEHPSPPSLSPIPAAASSTEAFSSATDQTGLALTSSPLLRHLLAVRRVGRGGGSVPVNVDHEGYVESENALFKHVAVREREQDSTYTPATANIAPR